jgi:heat-inducible transcriptional repressor
MLSQRTSTILNLLIDEYVETASPVASDGIARSPTLRVSPATVRSAMSQLTEAGYISRPHVSAGGVPSDLGYRHYVESMVHPPELSGRIRRRVDRWLNEAEADAGVWAQRCAVALSQLTANLAIVTEPRASSPRLQRLQLVFLQESVALLVIILGETRLLKRLLPLGEAVNQRQLDRVSERLNESLAGLNRQQIQARNVDWDPLEQQVRHDSLEMMSEAEQSDLPEHRVEGLSRLLNQPEFAAGERARLLVQMVEERVLLERIVSATREAAHKVFIGGENREESLRPFGVIVCRYGRPDGFGGAICVVGPTTHGLLNGHSRNPPFGHFHEPDGVDAGSSGSGVFVTSCRI